MIRLLPFVLALPLLGSAKADDASTRFVLVELYTSQGCDMCPEAEKILGAIAEDRRVVPIAFHVDYFNDPWRDVFSDPLYSRRQMAYNDAYRGPKPASYGLYYTPMVMVDGRVSVNGRDPAAIRAAVRAARSRPPGVSIDVDLEKSEDGASGLAKIRVARRSNRIGEQPLLLCAVLREDGVATDVLSGENRGKTLIARHPARATEYEDVALPKAEPVAREFRFKIDPSWDRSRLRLAVFVQDKRTAVVHQAIDVPWEPAPESRRPTR